MRKPAKTSRFPLLLTYAFGEGANSLVMNGVFAFALLFYTKALGLDPFWAGIALSVLIFSEAIAGPLMVHFSDTTRSRWGRRQPYLIFGGLLMVLCGYLIWTVPETFLGHQWEIFWYLLVINLLLQTGVTMFFVPYQVLPQGEAVTQSDLAIWRLGLFTFVGGSLVCLLALLAIRKHSVTCGRLEEMRAAAGLES